MRLRHLLALLIVLPWSGPVLAEGLTQTPLSIPARYPDGSSANLEALLLRPDGPGPYPIAIISHGTPRDPAERAEMTPLRYVPQAREFARRGWAVLALMRRGYGGSDGPYIESNGPCDNPDYLHSAEQSGEDVRQAVRYMARQPFADPGRIIAVGVSAGGFASLALSANPPPGLKAVISFAGGRGSRGDDDVCQENRLVAAFGTMGRTSRVPTLWIYAENDLFFGPALARRFWDAFTREGGRAEFVAAPANGKDGHFFFSAAIPQWTPAVDAFLSKNGLAPRAAPMALALPALVPPAELSAANRAKFPAYVEAPGNKAFAVSSDGAFGWKSGLRSLDEAQRLALETCARNSRQGCRIAYVNDRPAGAATASEAAGPPGAARVRLEPPAELSAANRAKFPAYVEAPGNKAFAVSSDGAFGWKSGLRSLDEAQRLALETCARNSRQGCRIAYVNDRPAGAATASEAAGPPGAARVRLEPPAELSAANRAKFAAYVEADGHKAFAVSSDGAFGWKSGMGSADAARVGALDNCAKYTRHTCYVVFVDDQRLR